MSIIAIIILGLNAMSDAAMEEDDLFTQVTEIDHFI
jgi:hypothetical protein